MTRDSGWLVIILYVAILALGGGVGACTGVYGEPLPSAVVGAALSSPVGLITAAWAARRRRRLGGSRRITWAALGVVTLVLFAFGSAPPEGIPIWNPLADTEIAPSYSDEKFAMVQTGMPSSELLSLLGAPVSKRLVGADGVEEIWAYSRDGASGSGDFAWKERAVLLRSGRVVSKWDRWRFD